MVGLGLLRALTIVEELALHSLEVAVVALASIVAVPVLLLIASISTLWVLVIIRLLLVPALILPELSVIVLLTRWSLVQILSLRQALILSRDWLCKYE